MGGVSIMWVTTHEGQLVNLALYQTIRIIPTGADSSVIVADKNISIFQGTPAECKSVISALHVILRGVDIDDLKTDDSAKLFIAQMLQ